MSLMLIWMVRGSKVGGAKSRWSKKWEESNVGGAKSGKGKKRRGCVFLGRVFESRFLGRVFGSRFNQFD